MTSGPTAIYPKSCPTLELKDLSDVIDFDLPSVEGEVFGFEYTTTGKYKRKTIEDKKHPKLGQLRDVDVPESLTDGTKYTISRDKGKWLITPAYEPFSWDIKFQMISPYVLTEDGSIFRKVLNSGPLLVSLIPSLTLANGSRNNVKIVELEDQRYFLSAIDVTKNTQLMFTPTYKLGNEATLVYEIVIKPVDNEPDEHEMSSGIVLKWKKAELKEKERVFILVRKTSADQIEVLSSARSVTVETKPKAKNFLHDIDLRKIDLISFYFSNQLLSDEILGKKFS